MSERIYGWLLRLYPRAFREEYGAAAQELFRDRYRAERGLLARSRLWLDVLGDLAVSIPREYRRRPAPPLPAGYRLSEEAVDAMLKRGSAPLLSFPAFALWFLIGWEGGAPLLQLFGLYGLLVLVGIGGTLRHRAGARRHLLSLELVLESDSIQRKQPGFDLTVARSTITRVVENDSGLAVWAANRLTLWVPSGLNGYQEVREHLAAWTPIDRQALHHVELARGYRVALLWMPSYVSALLVHSPFWFLPLALAAAGYLTTRTRWPRRGRPLRLGRLLLPLGLIALLAIKAVFVFRQG